ncbi:DUF1707 and DUF2154 domain-containing protein [Ningiella sp. W23]|uniref:DUF1707 and DUF2154 domain-containing protein n=1 Tax=Ningiella sp. W23 TaxID=3023715 RepID=UPI003757B81D
MPVKLEDRPIEQVKEEVIDVLVHNYSRGYISADAFERRLDVVIESESTVAMKAEVEDLEALPDDFISESKEKQFAPQYAEESAEESDILVNVMGGSDLRGSWVVPKKITSVSIMGGATLDFSDAQFSSPNTTIYSVAIMGGDTIYVPENVNVVCKAFCLMGGISNKAPSMGGRNAPTITIKGFMLMGGSNIKLKHTIKEKFIAFANQIKATFESGKT